MAYASGTSGRAGLDRGAAIGRYDAVRRRSVDLVGPLTHEDMTVQSAPFASPAKWHLAHTSWFFEAMLLQRFLGERYAPFNPRFGFLFNSYYNALGEQFTRAERGLVTRPGVEETLRYRGEIDDRVREFIAGAEERTLAEALPIVEIGLHHEQQHQELLLMDVKHLFSRNPLGPAYRERGAEGAGMETGIGTGVGVGVGPLGWFAYEEGVREVGHDPGGGGFAYDNESPRHRVYLRAFEIADRLVTNAEYAAFIADGGYRRAELWLSAGWSAVQREGWEAPLYWRREGDAWREFTLAGDGPLGAHAPVTHLSFFEAEAYARWAGARLPTEHEWEVAAGEVSMEGNLLESGRLHPAPALPPDRPEIARCPRQLIGDCWEWTRSDYGPYPGYRPPEGALGEYNGKFMCGQYVLRGGCCVTPGSHIRRTYRNFFHPEERWMFSGLRLARDLDRSPGRTRRR